MVLTFQKTDTARQKSSFFFVRVHILRKKNLDPKDGILRNLLYKVTDVKKISFHQLFYQATEDDVGVFSFFCYLSPFS